MQTLITHYLMAKKNEEGFSLILLHFVCIILEPL